LGTAWRAEKMFSTTSKGKKGIEGQTKKRRVAARKRSEEKGLRKEEEKQTRQFWCKPGTTGFRTFGEKSRKEKEKAN